MKKNVLISVVTEQSLADGGSDRIELVSPGTLYEKAGSYFIVYDESELTGMPDTKTTVRLHRDGVNVLRTGKFPSNMMFEEGKQNLSSYGTEYGDMTVTVNTERIISDISEEGGLIELIYTLELDHRHIGRNHIKITVSEQ